ncbi:hypothetical protein FHY55_06355 [Oceanicola sp. D3]|uniref:hypothetical protein n=1 Tax=Oceanicola sp. D3 TaxID=2587163 RepID=UPI00111CB4CF|nr:hypothetical protein [Oceanicola sp. D3]QDC08885.1 hypothetical protein FHY55_06355 [Oceanicola sp. D3]
MSWPRVHAVLLCGALALSSHALAAEEPAPRLSEMIPVAECWNVGGLSAEAVRTSVTVAFSLDRAGKLVDGSLEMVEWDGADVAAAEEAYKAARRAILICGRQGFALPAEQYEAWRNIRLTFDPRNMVVS